MLDFKVFNEIEKINSEWRQLVDDNSKFFYQTYPFNELCAKYVNSPLRYITNKIIQRTKFVVAYEERRPVCIAPLVIDRKHKIISLLRAPNSGYVDFIYEDPRHVKDVIKYIREHYLGYSFTFCFVPKYSPLYEMLEESDKFENYCVTVCEYESYFMGLSKKFRQNIRTSYNHLSSDNKKMKLLIEDMDSSSNILRSNSKIYYKRRKEWSGKQKYHQDSNIMESLKQNIYFREDIMFKSIKKNNRTIMVTLLIDDKPCAFFIGFKYVNSNGMNGVYVPRLAIDIDFYRYSPGIILINEFFKQYSNEVESFEFDLGRGSEQYKKSFGGEKYTTYKLN